MVVFYYIVAAVFVLISLKPLKEAAAYRMKKGQWVAIALGLIFCALWLVVQPSIWPVLIGGVLSYVALKSTYD